MNANAKRLLLSAALLMLTPLLAAAGNASGAHADKLTAAHVSVSSSDRQTELAVHASGWIAEIAKQPGFKAWRGAQPEITALGPGTHSWLVLVKQPTGAVIGYIVVQAVQEGGGYAIEEYGLGQYLYDEATRKRGVAQATNGTEETSESVGSPLYLHPLLAVWKNKPAKGSILLTDAMSGESLPLTENQWLKLYKKEEQRSAALLSVVPPAAKLARAVSNSSFDPYGLLPWLTNAVPLSADSNGKAIVRALEEKRQIRYTSERFDDKMRYVWSVTGFHRWENNVVYAALESDDSETGKRFVPLALLTEFGAFYD
ncbi:hypothetical protein [Paenibacillus sp. NPDC058071]|uniref:hypothetical protein n=1 Tax=Paenibacillus sp. NPDC058071 TaxID=3346326 RepID=UPI0036DF8B22